MDQFEAALLLDSKNVEARLGLALADIADGNAATALNQLKPLSISQAKNPEVFDLLAQAYKSLGKQDEAEHAASRAKLLRRSTRQ